MEEVSYYSSNGNLIFLKLNLWNFNFCIPGAIRDDYGAPGTAPLHWLQLPEECHAVDFLTRSSFLFPLFRLLQTIVLGSEKTARESRRMHGECWRQLLEFPYLVSKFSISINVLTLMVDFLVCSLFLRTRSHKRFLRRVINLRKITSIPRFTQTVIPMPPAMAILDFNRMLSKRNNSRGGINLFFCSILRLEIHNFSHKNFFLF